MKVMMFAMEYPPLVGGGGSYVQNLCRGLSQKGLSVRLITSGKKDSVKTLSPNLSIVRSINLHDLYFNHGSYLDVLDLLINQIDEFKPDLVHTHHSVEAILFEMIKLKYQIPHVVTQHKTPEYDENRKVGAKRIQFLFSNFLPNDLYISPSKTFEADLLESGVPKNKIKVVYPSINQNKYHKLSRDNHSLKHMSNRLQLDKNDKLIFIPTVIRPRKGVDFALASISKIRLPVGKIKILVSGLAEVSTNRLLVDTYQKLALPHTLLDLGRLNSRDMVVLYNLADLVVFGTQAEGLGLVVLESLACDCPIVTTNVMGVNEIIKNGENGLLSEYGDEFSFSKNIKRVLIDGNLRQRLIKKGRQTLIEKFNINLQVDQHVSLYQKLISNQH